MIALTSRMKIVLTGGPSAGKTTVAEALIRAYWDRAALVPESASILYRGGFPREASADATICQQRAIFKVQRELEEIIKIKSPDCALICDRGSLDGLAFWPTTELDFFRQMQTTKESELARYDWVIHLETASEAAYRPSTVRRESYLEAKALDSKLQDIWREHPRWAIIPNHIDFSMKITRAMLAVSMMMAGKPAGKIFEILSAI